MCNWFAGAAITKYLRLNGLNNRTVSALSSGGQRSMIQLLAGLASSEASPPLSFLCLHVVLLPILLCIDTSHIGFGLTPWPHFNVVPFIKTLPPNTVTFWGTRVRTSTCESGAGVDTLQPITVYLLGIQGADHIKAGTKNFAFHVGTWHLVLGGKTMTNLDSILKSRDITLPTKVHIVTAMVFPVVIYGWESWTIKKTERQRMMLLNCGVGED